MVQEGALWPSVMIRFGPHWCNSKIAWANFVNVVLDVSTKKQNNVTNLNVVGAIKKYIGSAIA